MKYIRLYEDLKWEFDEDETPDIHPEFIGHEDFYFFLVKNGVLDKYVEQFNKWGFDNNKYDNIKDFLDNEDAYFYISKAFKWNVDLWVDIHNKWEHYILKI